MTRPKPSTPSVKQRPWRCIELFHPPIYLGASSALIVATCLVACTRPQTAAQKGETDAKPSLAAAQQTPAPSADETTEALKAYGEGPDDLPQSQPAPFPIRALAALHQLDTARQVEKLVNGTETQCMDYWGQNMRLCSVNHPPSRLCLGDIACNEADFIVKGSHLISARLTVREAALQAAVDEARDALGDPDLQETHPVVGVCFNKSTATYNLPNGSVAFEYTDCGAAARPYGVLQAIIISS